MNYLLNKFLPRIKFDSYEDFKKNYTVIVPDDFNFGFDVVDAWAEEEPDKRRCCGATTAARSGPLPLRISKRSATGCATISVQSESGRATA